MNIQLLEDIAYAINADSLLSDLHILKNKVAASSNLYLPIIGEFNAGKTTLLNSIIGDNMLEVDNRPTTATIFQIHFGCEKSFAEVHNSDGSTKVVEDVSSLNNVSLSNIPVVDIYSSSKILPPSIILVDTPGISSMIPQHRQALISCLPQADGILLAIDINKGCISKSLYDFITETGIDKHRIDLILTHCESKSQKEIEDIVNFLQTSDLQINKIVRSSINDIHEVIDLLINIQEQKDRILLENNRNRASAIAKKLDERLTTLLCTDNQNNTLENEILRNEAFLAELNTQIDYLKNTAKSKIISAASDVEADFKNTIISRLDFLLANKNADYDKHGVNIINNAATLATYSLRSSAKQIIISIVKDLQSHNIKLEENEIENIDINNLFIGNFSYDLSLNGKGHEYDGYIANGIKMTAAIVAAYNGVGPIPCYPSTDSNDSIDNSIETSVQSNPTINNDNTFGDSNILPQSGMIPQQITSIQRKLEVYDSYDNQVGERFGLQKGLVESLVGLVTEETMAKPQRIRAINEYVNTVLVPEFRCQMESNIQWVIEAVCSAIKNDTQNTITETKNTLLKLQETYTQSQNEYELTMQTYQSYKDSLNEEFLC